MTAFIGVTGATGALGGRISHRLAVRGARQRLIVRDPARAPQVSGADIAVASFGDTSAMRSALTGVDTLLLVSAAESADRVAQHLSAVDAAVDAGVSRVVYISFLGAAPDATFTLARQHWQTEEHIRSTPLSFTFLRDNLYLDVFPHFVGADGVIRGPAGEGRVAAVARDDIADVATAVLLEAAAGRTTHDGRTYQLTGAQAVTLHEVAAQLSSFSGRDISYHAETEHEAYASRAHYGAPDWEVAGWVSSYLAIAAGEMAAITDDVERVAGHPPMTLAEYLTTDRSALARLRWPD